ncbi:MAG: hypothetical protein F9K13_03920 [Candidatus Methylomirabilis oxygeniifera]|uniref:Hemerythrin-like domain-containing protein n=1 Tax=Methylomirabilis oxygeniifera TaxID=671143 RepID=D5MLH6_METO1|nr:MAG: hypothetical protein F9K13_03920 [Candidatus Methylomirabilis oxyfera]CBE67842.1 Protein of unknown function [Candidatus Methylomirabilis oxyfera]
MQDAWVEQMEQTLNPMSVPMDNPIGTIESKDRQAILAALLVHLWHGYRKMRDCLTELEDAMLQGNREQARSLLLQIKRFCGTSFRYEEDAVLPALDHHIGSEQLRELTAAHDLVIRHVRRLEGLLSTSPGGEEQIEQGRMLIHALLMQVACTAGLTLLIETLPQDALIRILQARERALVEGKDLYEWDKDIRG